MKFVFFSFKHRYRYGDLNNFLNSRIYGKYFILNLGGPFKSFIAKLLTFLKIGKAISCDGKPYFAMFLNSGIGNYKIYSMPVGAQRDPDNVRYLSLN